MPFWKRKTVNLSPAHVGVDVHNHLLPGVDDGVANQDEASRCIGAMLALGYHGAVVTPHINHRLFKTTERSLRSAFPPFAEAMGKTHPSFRLSLGAEYMMDEMFIEKVLHRPDELLTFGAAGRPKLLVEFNTLTEPLFIDELLVECGKLGVQPIIAHVERYLVVQADRANRRLTRWRSGGGWIQINLGSLAGQFGRSMQLTARRVFQAGLVDILGSDLHSPRLGLDPLAKAWRWLATRGDSFNPTTQATIV